MNRSNAPLTGDHFRLSAEETETPENTATPSQARNASIVALETIAPLGDKWTASSHIVPSSIVPSSAELLSMRLVAQKKVLVGKLQELSIAPHVFLQSYAERLRGSLLVQKNYDDQHPFSDNFQEIFKTKSQLSIAIHRKKLKAMQDFILYLKNNIQEKYSFLSLDQFNNKSNTKNLATYLLEHIDDDKLHYFISELTYFYQSILEIENEEVAKVAFSIFPPSNPLDFQCLEGTRARLFSAISYIKDYINESDNISLKSTLDQKISKAGECVVDDTIIKENFRFLLNPSVEVHSKNFLSYLSGISSSIISKKDAYYLTPLVDFPASIAHDFLSNLSKNLNGYTTEYKETLINQFEEFFNDIYKFDDEKSSLADLSDHYFLQYISSLDPDFELRSEKFLISKDEYYFSFILNKPKILGSVYSILKNGLSGGILKNDNDISLLEAYGENASDKITALILSKDLDKVVSAIHILYVLGERFKGNSPVRFISILIDLSKTLEELNQDTSFSIGQFFSSVSNVLSEKPAYSSVTEKINRIIDRFEHYASTPRESIDNYKNLISYRLGNNYSSEELFMEYLKGGGSLYDFQSLNPIVFNKSSKKIDDFLLSSQNASKFVFHPELKALVNKFLPYLTTNSIGKIIYCGIFFKQENKLIELIQDDFFKASIPCIDNKTQKMVLNLSFQRKDFSLAEKLLDVGFNADYYMDVYDGITENSHRSYQYNNLITIAAKDKKFSLLEKLIKKGVSITEIGFYSPFGLFRLSFDMKDVTLLSFLFSHGLKIETLEVDNAYIKTCHEVAARNLDHFIPVLMKNSFSINNFIEPAGRRKMSALHLAAKSNSLAVIEQLLEVSLPEEAWLEQDANFYSAFAYLISGNNVPAIEVLMKRGIALDTLLSHTIALSNQTTLQYLVAQGKFELFNFLYDQIPEDQKNHYLSQKYKNGETLIHFSMMNINENTKKVLEILCRHLSHDEIVSCDNHGKNLFHFLVNQSDFELVPEKMEYLVNILYILSAFIEPEHANIFDQEGYAPLHIAARNENFSLVSEFFDCFTPSSEVLNKKISIYFWQKNQTIFELAMSQGHVDLAQRIALTQGNREDFSSFDSCTIL